MKRFAKIAGKALLALVLAVIALVACVLASLDLPPMRRLAAREVNELVFALLFKGRITIGAIGHLDPFGVAGVTFRVADPQGRPILEATGISGRFATVKLLRSLIGRGELVVDVPQAEVRDANVLLDLNDAGMALANAFLPKNPRPPSPGPRRGVRVVLPRIHLDHAWGHGQIARAPYIDADVTAADASLAILGDELTLEVKRVGVVARGIARGQDANGHASGHLVVGIGEKAELGGGASWKGSVGAIQEKLSAQLEKGRLDLSADVPGASPDTVRAFVPSWSPEGDVTLHAEAHGPLADVAVSMHAESKGTTADVRGSAAWTPIPSAKLHLDVSKVDLHAFGLPLPRSVLGLSGDVSASLSETGRIEGEAELAAPAGSVERLPTPPLRLTTHGFREKSGSFGGEAELRVAEGGAPTTLSVRAVPTETSAVVYFDVASHDVKIDAVAQLPGLARGTGHVLGHGSLDLQRLWLDASLETSGHAIQKGPLTVESLNFSAHGHGLLTNPNASVSLHATGIDLGGHAIRRVDLTATGAALRPHVNLLVASDDLPSLDGDVDIDVLAGPTFTNAKVSLAHHHESARVTAESVRVGGGSVAVDGVSITGFGEPVTGSFDLARGALTLHAHGAGLDMDRIARFLGETDVQKGTIKLDADLSIRRDSASGHAAVALDGTTAFGVQGVGGQIEARIQDRSLDAKVHLSVGELGALDLDAQHVVLGGDGALAQSSWRRAWGKVDVSGRADLGKLLAHLPDGSLPLNAIRGEAVLSAKVERDGATDFTPDVALDLDTTNLALEGLVPKDGKGKAPWVLEGIDPSVSLYVNGDTGYVVVKANLKDAKGTLAALSVESGAVPYKAIYERGAALTSALLATKLEAHLELPEQSTTRWPAWIVRNLVQGRLRANVDATGSIEAPVVDVDAELEEAQAAATRLSMPLSLAVKGHYDGRKLDARVAASQHDHEREHDVVTANVELALAVQDLIQGASPLPWTASGKLHVDQFPLLTIGPLDDMQVRGHLSGDASITGLHEDARADLSLAVPDLKIGEVSYKNASASLGADGKGFHVDAALDQTDGYARVSAKGEGTWGAVLAPTPDPERPLAISFDAKRFRAAALLPLVQGTFDELDGRLDAGLRLEADSAKHQTRVTGSASLSDGLVELGAFGGELHDVSAKLAIASDGLLRVLDLRASGINGKILGSATARMDGLHLAALNARLEIPKSAPLPLSAFGSPLGTVDGSLNLSQTLSKDKKSIDVAVVVPKLHIALPEAGGQNVQTLGPIQGVDIGTRAEGGRAFVPTPLDAAVEEEKPERSASAPVIHVTTKLGDDVSIRRGTDLKVELGGGPTITVDSKTSVTGQLSLKGGSLDVYGKTFQIEHGTVTFVGEDASNPQVAVTAGWSAPDGTRVYADFIGPLKTGKVTLRSEPPLSKNDIVALLLFGTADGQTAAAQGAPGTSSAAGVAGGVATQPLNHALDQFGLSAVSAKVDTSAVTPKPEVEVQIAKNISVQLAVVLGTPPPGSNPDTTLLTVDWRFLRKWSLESTVGNAGSTIVDAIWQYRY